jgi:hypothetical protein
VEQHDVPDEAVVPRPPLLLPSLLGREANNVHQVLVSRPQEENVPVERRRQDINQIGKRAVSRNLEYVSAPNILRLIKLDDRLKSFEPVLAPLCSEICGSKKNQLPWQLPLHDLGDTGPRSAASFFAS